MEFIIIESERTSSEWAKFSQPHVADVLLIVVLGDSFIGRMAAILADWLKYGYCQKEDLPVFRNSIAKNRAEQLQKMAAIRCSRV